MIDTERPNVEINTLSSSLLVGLFSQINENKTLSVLDMGLAAPTTVSFLGQTKCRLQFSGFINSDLKLYNNEEIVHAEKVALFKKALNFQAGTKFDIVLFWDLFCYLSKSAIAAFLEVLTPHLHSKTRAHSIGLLNARQQMAYSDYGINSISQLWYQPSSTIQPSIYAYSRHDFSRILRYLTIDRSCLLSGNRVENLLMINTQDNQPI